jgi:hypothetical protein
MPISLIGCIFIMNYTPNFDTIAELCYKRNICYSYCTNDNYPRLTCDAMELPIIYNGNDYNKFFLYPDPHTNLDHETEFEIENERKFN